jgi:hypothetical protein
MNSVSDNPAVSTFRKGDRVEFTHPKTGEVISGIISPYTYPFPDHKASKQEQIKTPRREIKVVTLNDYESAVASLPGYAGRRGAIYDLKVLANNLTQNEMILLTGSVQACLK